VLVLRLTPVTLVIISAACLQNVQEMNKPKFIGETNFDVTSLSG